VYKAEKPSEEDVLKQLPKPSGWKMLIALPEMKDKTKGGVVLPEDLLHREQTASILGFVLKQGDLCYQDERKFPTGPWCKEGDWIIFRAYSGTRFKVGDQEFRLVNDDTCEAVVPDPTKVERTW
jgi:co-chaperonin GroES (HSP10)